VTITALIYEYTKIFLQQVYEMKPKRVPTLRDYQVLNGINLFGFFEEATINTKPEAIETFESTSIQTALLGTVVGSEQNTVSFIEEKKMRKHRLYMVGYCVQGAIVKMILRGKVVIKLGNKDEILTMDEDSRSKSGNRKGRPGASGEQTFIRVRLSCIERSMRKINTLLSQVRIRPYFRNGEADGLSILRIRTNSIFTKPGLRNEDVILAFDEIPIQSPDDILSLYEKMKLGYNISIQITRRGRQKTINYEMR
jgi:general secretion pathway protein C